MQGESTERQKQITEKKKEKQNNHLDFIIQPTK